MRNLLFVLFLSCIARADGIAWFSTWKSGLAEARQSGKPILLVAAAPHCHNISGIW
jgi:hypothetical protein